MNRIAMEVTEFLHSKGILSHDQYEDYRLEIAYRIGYADAVRNYAIWKNGEQVVGCRETPLKTVMAEFKNAEIPERY